MSFGVKRTRLVPPTQMSISWEGRATPSSQTEADGGAPGMILPVGTREGVLAPHFMSADSLLPRAARGGGGPRACLVLALGAVWLSLGAGDVSAASPTLRNLCPREWRVGDVVRTVQRDALATQVVVIHGSPTLPAGLLPESSESLDLVAIERCLEVGPTGGRRSAVVFSTLRTRNGGPDAPSPLAHFRLHVEGSEASFAPTTEREPKEVVQAADQYFDRQPWTDDLMPDLLRSIVVSGPDSAGLLRRESLAPSSSFTTASFDMDSFRGRWWVEGLSDVQVVVAFEFSILSRRPLSNEVLAQAGWLTGGVWDVRGALYLRRDSRLPESRWVSRIRVGGCVSLGDQLLAVAETMDLATGSTVLPDLAAPTPRLEGGVGVPGDERADPGVSSRCVAVMEARDGQVGRLGGGLLVEPDLVLTATHLLLLTSPGLTCVGPDGNSSDVSQVTFPRPRCDWALLRLRGPISDPFPKVSTRDPTGAPLLPGTACTVVAMDDAGRPTPMAAKLFRVSREAGAFALVPDTGPGSSGSPVFVADRGFLGIISSGFGGGSIVIGPMIVDGLDTHPSPDARWLPLASWRDSIPEPARRALRAGTSGRLEGLEDPETARVWERVGREVPGAAPLAARWFSTRGRSRGLRGDIDGARADFARADALEDSESWVRGMDAADQCVGTTRAWAVGDTDAALKASQRGAGIAPSDVHAQLRLARSLYDVRDARWKDVVRRLAGEDLPRWAIEEVADWASRGADFDLIDLWASVADRDPGTAGLALWLRAVRAVHAREYDLAKQYLTAAPPGATPVPQGTQLAAWLLLRERSLEQANRLCASLDLYAANSTAIATAVYAARALDETDAAWHRLQVGLARFPWDRELLEYATRLNPPGQTAADARYAPILTWLAAR